MKNHVSLFTVILLFFCTGLTAQVSLSTYPTTASNNGAGGVSFELSTSKTIILNGLDVALYTAGSSNLDIYYRVGGVQSSPGIAPTINGANGWVLLGSGSISAPTAGIPVAIPVPLSQVLTPGTYGIFINSSASVGYKTWVSGSVDLFTDGLVTIKTGQNAGYGGPAPNPGNHPRQFVGTVHYAPAATGPNNAGVASFDAPTAFCSGAQDIIVTIENAGNNPINPVTVNWTFNGVLQTPVVHNQTLDTLLGTGPNTAQITLGNKAFTSGVEDEIVVWTSLPNGVADTSNGNDTIIAYVQPSLSGTYSIDPFGSGSNNYTTFSDAVNALNSFGVCGPVVFEVAGGLYNEQFTINKLIGSSEVNTVIFKADPNNVSPVELSFSGSASNNYIANFNGCSYVTMEGLSFLTSGTYPTAITMGGSASHNTIKGCEITGPLAATTADNNSIIYISGSDNAYNKIIDNNIYGGSNGIYYRGTSTADLVKGAVIEGNTIQDPYYRGIYLYYSNGAKVHGNKVTSVSGYGTGYGIYTGYSDSGLVVTSNQVLSMGSDWPTYGIYVYYCDHADDLRGVVANNMVHVGGPGSTGAKYGLSVYYNNFSDVVFNTVVSEGTSTTSRPAYFYGGANNIARNNNMMNYGNGYVIYTLTGNFNWDYNNLATSGSTFAYHSGAVSDFTSWQGLGHDANSINVNNIYANPDSLRTCDLVLYKKGIEVAAMNHDFDGDPRIAGTPNIGADEFIADANDFIIGDTVYFCGGDELKIGATMNDATFNWSTGANTPTIIVTEEGNYTVSVDGPCVTGMVDDIQVIDVNPVANFTIQEGDFIGGFVNNSEWGTSYHWDFGDGTTSTEMNPWHKYADNGPYTVTLTVMNYCDTISFSQPVQFSVGLNEITFGSKVNVYPNPASNIINLAFGNIEDQAVQVEMMDMRGQQISNQLVKVSANSVESIDISSLTKGIYLIKMTTDSEVATRQIVVQ